MLLGGKSLQAKGEDKNVLVLFFFFFLITSFVRSSDDKDVSLAYAISQYLNLNH